MPKRRLHGETQKRRKKPSTRLLKRKDSIVRVTATFQPASFERSPHPEREDLEFQEAMRELEVRRSPWSGESPARRRKVESVQFLAGEEEEILFRQSMEGSGVRPLDGRRVEPSNAPSPRSPKETDADTAGLVKHEEAQEDTREQESTETRARARASSDPQDQPESGQTVLQPTVLQTTGFQPTVFQTQNGREEMEAWFQETEFQPEWKFAGVEEPKRYRSPSRKISPEAEPDDVLDLHGKTLEEAIQMVQNFLLVSHRQRLRAVLIITGKGHNSGSGGPVLKGAVQHWLERNGERFMKGFQPAPARLGGEGAIWVALR